MYANLHDLLVDSSKNGYTFGDAEWIKFKDQHKDPAVKLEPVAHRKASEVPLSSAAMFSKDNINDYLTFQVARPQARDYLESRKPDSRPCKADPAISSIHTVILRGDDIGKTVVMHLQKDLSEIFNQYRLSVARLRDNIAIVPDEARGRNGAAYDDLIWRAYQAYRRIQPMIDHRECDLVRGWLESRLRHEPTMWERIKASALAMLDSRFAFALAGPVLCYIKAFSTSDGSPRHIVMEVYQQMKIRSAPKRLDKYHDDDETEADDDDFVLMTSTIVHADVEQKECNRAPPAPAWDLKPQGVRKAGHRMS